MLCNLRMVGVMSKTIVNIIITTLRKIPHDHHLEKKDSKHVHNGGSHGRKVPLPLFVDVLLVHQIFNLVVSIKI